LSIFVIRLTIASLPVRLVAGINDAATGLQRGFVGTPVPEPGALGLLIGGFCLSFMRVFGSQNRIPW
jgi:hypothetical protein